MELLVLKSICSQLATAWFFQNIIQGISIFALFPLDSEQACFNQSMQDYDFGLVSHLKADFLELKDLNEIYNLTEVRYSFLTNTFHPLWDIVGSMAIVPQPYDYMYRSSPYFPGFPVKNPNVVGESIFLILKKYIFLRSATDCIWYCQKKWSGVVLYPQIKGYSLIHGTYGSWVRSPGGSNDAQLGICFTNCSDFSYGMGFNDCCDSSSQLWRENWFCDCSWTNFGFYDGSIGHTLGSSTPRGTNAFGHLCVGLIRINDYTVQLI